MDSSGEIESLIDYSEPVSYNSFADQTTHSINQHDRSSRNKRRQYISTIIILITLILERISFFALTANLYLFLNQKLGWLSYDAMYALYFFTGITYITSLFGGWVADAKIGRFCTITIALFINACLYSILPLIAKNEFTSYFCLSTNPKYNCANDETNKLSCGWVVYLLLTFIGISSGTIRVNIAPFGAEQVQDGDQNCLRVFFNWFYWSVNIGAFISIGGIAFIQQSLEDGFYKGYLIASASLWLGFILFCVGRFFYRIEAPSGSPISEIWHTLKEFIQRRTTLGRLTRISSMFDTDHEDECLIPTENIKFLGYIILVFIGLIPYWIIYFQMQTTFQDQGLHMKLFLQGESNCNATVEELNQIEYTIPAAWLTLFDVIFMLAFIPLMDRLVYPWLDRHGYSIHKLGRIAMGMGFAIVAMAIAGGLETYRLTLVQDKSQIICQKIGNSMYYAANLSIFWQIPQYSMIGISEVFASVAVT